MSLNLAPHILSHMHYRRLAHAHKSGKFASRITASKLHQIKLDAWDNVGIWLQTILQIAPHNIMEPRLHNAQKSHNILNYMMHTKMSMLEEWQQAKENIVTLTTSTFLILKNHKSFSFFGFAFM
jgi:hypothetical protein